MTSKEAAQEMMHQLTWMYSDSDTLIGSAKQTCNFVLLRIVMYTTEVFRFIRELENWNHIPLAVVESGNW